MRVDSQFLDQIKVQRIISTRDMTILFFYKGLKSRLVCWDVGCYVRKPCLSSHFTTIRYSYRPGRKVIITRGGSTSSQSNFMTL